MTITYMAIPKARVTFGATVADGLISASVTMEENTYFTAQLKFSNSPALYPTPIDTGETVLVETQDGAVGGAWTTLFTGTVLFCDFSFGSTTEIFVQCVGLGYSLNMMNVAEEYGTQSRNPTETTTLDALSDATVGIVPKWVNHYAGGTNDSGYAIDYAAYVNDIIGYIPYISFPWKPANKCLDDLCDLITALTANTNIAVVSVGAGSTTNIQAAGYYQPCTDSYIHFTSGVNDGLERLVTSTSTAGGPPVTTFVCAAFPANYTAGDTFNIHTASGPHWIVDNSGNLRVKRINAGQTGWTHYFGNSSANATLVAGVDFFDGDFQILGKEANVVLYKGIWRRPSNGDSWTDNSAHTLWGTTADTLSSDAANQIVGTDCVTLTVSHYPGAPPNDMYYPSAKTAAWDFTSFTDFNTPTINFYVRRSAAAANIALYLETSAGNYFMTSLTIAATDTWQHFSFPVGTYSNVQLNSTFAWLSGGAPDWSDINDVLFQFTGPNGEYLQVDGLYFGGSQIIRIARQEFPNEVATTRGTLGQTETSSLLTADAANGQHHASVVNGALFAVGNVVTISDATQTEACEVAAIAANILEFAANLTNSYHVADAGVVTRTGNPIRFKVITDDIGKDDTLASGTPGTTDTGLMAQLAKSELYKLVTTPTLGKFTTPMISTWLPGQYAYIGSADYRVTKLTHMIDKRGLFTSFEVTTDVTNSHSRRRFEDINKIYAAIRPEYQDRQASSLKSGNMDIRITPLEEAYDI